jgi:uncharacterized protein (TIGR02001 family)
VYTTSAGLLIHRTYDFVIFLEVSKMKMNKLAMVCGVAVLGMSVQAMAEVSMNIGATSNYVWRGMTQTGNEAAIQGGLDWSSDTGLYAGTWASNVGNGGNAGYELDLYGGYSGKVEDFGYDAGLIYYTYDEDADANFLELGLSGSWKFLTLGMNYTLDGEANDNTDPFVEGDLYYYAGASFDLPEDYSAGLTIGSYNFENDGKPGVEDYTHYQLDLTKSAGDFGDVTLSLSDTDLKDTNAAGEDGDMRFFVSWGKTF